VAEMPLHEVAVTVFARVPGVDQRDAENRLEGALRYRMLWNGDGLTLPQSPGPGTTAEPIMVHEIVEAGAALGNGYLWARVTGKAERESPHPKQRTKEDDS